MMVRRVESVYSYICYCAMVSYKLVPRLTSKATTTTTDGGGGGTTGGLVGQTEARQIL